MPLTLHLSVGGLSEVHIVGITMRLRSLFSVLLLTASSFAATAHAETVRVAIGTQDTTINTATAGLIVRELNLLEKYLPKDGKFKDVKYDIQWKNFTSGAPITNEQIAGKIDFGIMADFPGSLNGVAHEKAGRKSQFITVLQGSVKGSGNGIVVPAVSPAQSITELKGKTISVPFASTSHGLLLRAIKAQGWDPNKDVKIITQAPEVAGPALQSNQIEAHADFVPFAELFPWRGFARKIYDGSQAVQRSTALSSMLLLRKSIRKSSLPSFRLLARRIAWSPRSLRSSPT